MDEHLVAGLFAEDSHRAAAETNPQQLDKLRYESSKF